MARAGFFDVVIDPNGRPIRAVTVTVYDTGTTNLYSGTIWAGPTAGTTLANPFVANDQGEVQFWLVAPTRVDLAYSKNGYTGETETVDAIDTSAATTAVAAEAAARAAADALLIPLTQKAAASGVATLDGATTIPDAQIPATIARDSETTAAVAAEATLRSAATALLIPLTQKGAASGVATLDGSTTVPDAQIPATIARDAETTAAVAAEATLRGAADSAHAASASAHSGTYVPVGSTAYVAQVAAPTGVAATDTAAIHAARDAAGVGGKLVFQAGTYATTGLTANVASQTWDCRGATFTSTGAATPVLRLAAAGITVEGGTFSGASGTGTGITNTAGDSCTVRNATVSATSSYGIYAANVNYVTIDGCYVTGSADIGIFVEVTTGSDIVGPTISRCRVDRTALGAGLTEGAIKVHGTGTLKVQRAKIHDNRVLMPTSPVSINCICIEVWNGCPYASIRGNHTYGGAMGVSVDRSDYTAVSGNVIFGASSTGVEVPQSIGVAVSGNTIDGNDLCLRGVWIDGSSTYSTGTTVSANAIRRCTTHGVHQVNGNDLVVSGNTIKHDTAGALNGVYIQGVTGFAVTGNLIDCGGVGSRCVVIDTSTDGPITGNHFRQPVNPPVLLTVASAFTIDHVSVVGNASTGLAGGAVVSTSTSGGGAVSTNFNQWLNGDGQNRLNNTNVRVHTSTGTPESVFSADPGSLFMRSDGSVASALYVKGSGTGTTGWVAMDPVDEDTLTTGEPTMKRRFVSSSGVTRGTGTMRLAYFTARKTESITQIRLFSGGTLAGATPTLIRAAVYSVAANGDLTELATTATDTSLFAAANTAYTKSLSGTVSKVAGQRYAIGELVVTGAAVPNGIGQSTINAVEATTIAPRIGGAVTGLADLPASPILNASVVASGNILYAVLLP